MCIEHPHDLNRCERTQRTVEIAAVRDGIDVRAEQDRGEIAPVPFTSGDNVPGGIDRRREPRLAHDPHDVGAAGHVRIREADTTHPVPELASGWASEVAQLLEMAPQPRLIGPEARRTRRANGGADDRRRRQRRCGFEEAASRDDHRCGTGAPALVTGGGI